MTTTTNNLPLFQKPYVNDNGLTVIPEHSLWDMLGLGCVCSACALPCENCFLDLL
jgi:hypothetical protein